MYNKIKCMESPAGNILIYICCCLNHHKYNDQIMTSLLRRLLLVCPSGFEALTNVDLHGIQKILCLLIRFIPYLTEIQFLGGTHLLFSIDKSSPFTADYTQI